MAYPRHLHGAQIPVELEHIVRDLGSQLLAGATPVHAQLREQLRRASISQVTLTGAGLYADLHVPADSPMVSPPDMIGGEVTIDVDGLDAPAGSLIKVEQGRLAFIEIYTFGDVGWPDCPHTLRYRDPMPLPIPGEAS